MATAISNAIGTARQFTPQPDNVYQGRYNGLRPDRAYYQRQASTLGQSIARLSEAFNSWRVGHERMLDATGHKAAQDMVNSETPEDIEKLNTIDAAQTYGFVDDTANPYFRAYADKLRGSFLSSKMKQAYDEKYYMEPAKSMDDEAKRFSEFSRDWHDKVVDTVENRSAFDAGYTEAHLSHINSMWGEWQKKRRQEDVLVTMSETTNQLGDITEHVPQLLQEAGGKVDSVLSQAQGVWNNTRLMGLPPEYRYKLLKDWTDELVKTGRMNREQIGELMDGLTIQTHMDGSITKASGLLNMMDVTSNAAKFNMQFTSQETANTVRNFIQRRDVDGWYAYIENLRKTDPEAALNMNQYTAYVRSHIEQQQRSERAADQRRMEKAYKEQQKAYKSQAEATAASNILDKWLDGQDFYDGRLIKTYPIKKENIEPVFLAKIAEAVQDNDMDRVGRLLTIPLTCASDLKITFNAEVKRDLFTLRPDNVDAVDDGTKARLSFYAKNANGFETHLSDEVIKELQTLQTLSEVNGGITEGLRWYATYRGTPEASRKEWRGQVESSIRSRLTVIDGIQALGGGYSTISVFSDPSVREDVLTMATALMCAGNMSPEEALNESASYVAKNYLVWRNCAIPMGVLDGLKCEGVAEPRMWLEAALEEWAGDYDTPVYNRHAHTFFFGSGGSISVRDLYENAKILRDEAAASQQDNAKTPKGDNDTTLTPKQVNAYLLERVGVDAESID